jgi:hypothetical protein
MHFSTKRIGFDVCVCTPYNKFKMIRKYKHIREVQKYLDMLMIDQVNLTIQASRFGWTEELQNQLINSALLIRKYQRRLRLIKM